MNKLRFLLNRLFTGFSKYCKIVGNTTLYFTQPCWMSLLRFFPSPLSKRWVCIVRLDRIGDYLLFRNFLPSLIESKKYRNKPIMFIGNQKWKEFAELLDNDYIDQFIWIDIDRFAHREWVGYKFRKLLEIWRFSFSDLIHPTFSRDSFSDEIVHLIHSKRKIGQVGDDVNQPNESKRKTNTYYTRLIELEGRFQFEFDRNRFFIESLLETKFDDITPSLTWVSEQIVKESIIIFPGVGHPSRQWSPENFSVLIQKLKENTSLPIYLAGGASENRIAQFIISNETDHLVDFCGVPVRDLLNRISNARLVISGDSAGYHLGALMGVNTLCLSNGNHFGRFLPYPDNYRKSVEYLFPQEFLSEVERVDDIAPQVKYASIYNMNELKVEEVLKVVIKYL